MNFFSAILFANLMYVGCLFSEGKLGQIKTNQQINSVVLYIKQTCPYCQKVLSVLERLHKNIEIRDISQNDHFRDELIQIGGKKQVPCIVINGKARYESADIIQWLIENKNLY